MQLNSELGPRYLPFSVITSFVCACTVWFSAFVCVCVFAYECMRARSVEAQKKSSPYPVYKKRASNQHTLDRRT